MLAQRGEGEWQSKHWELEGRREMASMRVERAARSAAVLVVVVSAVAVEAGPGKVARDELEETDERAGEGARSMAVAYSLFVVLIAPVDEPYDLCTISSILRSKSRSASVSSEARLPLLIVSCSSSS